MTTNASSSETLVNSSTPSPTTENGLPDHPKTLSEQDRQTLEKNPFYQDLADKSAVVGVTEDGRPVISLSNLAFKTRSPTAPSFLGTKPQQPILSFYQELLKADVPLNEIATELTKHKNTQIQEGLFSQNFFTVSGSSVEGIVQDPNTGAQKNAILWCINHYTGLNRDPRVIQAAQKALAQYGTSAGTSAMSCGHNSLHKHLEIKLASLVGKEDALYFPTGYSTNLGAISGLATKKDLIIFDRESHASIIDGIRLSGATFLSFRHNDVNDLEKKLSSIKDQFLNVFVVVESAYSMSGDLAPLQAICELKKQFKFFLYVDEAHTFGFYGQRGAGLCSELGVTEQVDFLMSTLSKATASVGGFIACAKKFRALLEWAANAYIFQAACSPADTAAVIASLEILEKDSSITKRLHQNNIYMRTLLLESGFELGHSKSPVIPIFIDNEEALLKASQSLLNAGIFTVSVVYPAVKRGNGRLRFIVTANHTFQQIEKTVQKLKDLVLPIAKKRI
ncbi:MAG: aminotransferase class I/II-fold pyridoxal phosphate-dependent enzyme [Candidatus Margulisiibacteriota bacterium]